MVSEVRFLFWCLQTDFILACELWLSQTIRGCIDQSFLSKHTDGYLNYRVKKSFNEECKNTPATSVREPRLERAYLWINPQILGEWPLVSHEQGILLDQVLWNFDYSTLWEFSNTRLQTWGCLCPRYKHLEECESVMNRMNKEHSSKWFSFPILANNQISAHLGWCLLQEREVPRIM